MTGLYDLAFNRLSSSFFNLVIRGARLAVDLILPTPTLYQLLSQRARIQRQL